MCAYGHPTTSACTLPHSVGKSTRMEVAAGLARRSGLTAQAVLLLCGCFPTPFPLPRLNLMGGRHGPMLFVCVHHSLCQRVFCSQLSVCEMVYVLGLIALTFSSAKETGLGPTAPGEIQTAEEPRTAPSAAVAGPLLR